jgi:hypothetical protein
MTRVNGAQKYIYYDVNTKYFETVVNCKPFLSIFHIKVAKNLACWQHCPAQQ